MKHKLLISSLLSLGFVTFSYAAPSDYNIDKTHSSVSFKVRHLLSKTVGTFDTFDAKVQFEAGKLDSLKTDATIEVKSINTKLQKRDEHLLSPDFFDVSKFPTMSLKNTKITDVKDNKAKLTGDLTLKGVTKPVVFDLEYLGNVKAFDANKAAFTATTTINREDFGLTWNKVLEAGQVVVGKEVDIEINIEADEVAKKAPEAKKEKKKKA